MVFVKVVILPIKIGYALLLSVSVIYGSSCPSYQVLLLLVYIPASIPSLASDLWSGVHINSLPACLAPMQPVEAAAAAAAEVDNTFRM